MLPSELAKFIDYSCLKPTATRADIEKACAEARENGFYAVCVNSCWVGTARRALENSGVKIVSVVGFPLGAASTEAKACEAKKAVKDGADELDMVMNIGLLKSRDFSGVEKDVAEVKRTCGRRPLKVIIECCYLTDDEKTNACKIAAKAGAEFVKTSTGFGIGGATAHDVALMKKALEGTGVKIKAAGGIKTYGNAMKMINAGASRVGTSAGIEILKGAPDE